MWFIKGDLSVVVKVKIVGVPFVVPLCRSPHFDAWTVVLICYFESMKSLRSAERWHDTCFCILCIPKTLRRF